MRRRSTGAVAQRSSRPRVAAGVPNDGHRAWVRVAVRPAGWVALLGDEDLAEASAGPAGGTRSAVTARERAAAGCV